MGWGNCGEDSTGRPIGYLFEAICDEPGCEAEIDRGLAYACGDMHGESEYACEQYFCQKHMTVVETPQGETIGICALCIQQHEVNDDLIIL